MISLIGISHNIGERELFSQVNFNINQNDRYGLVGPNGSGKTTLLRIIRGEILPTSGLVQRAKDINIGYLPQEEIVLSGNTLIGEVLKDYHLILKKLKAAGKGITENPMALDLMKAYERSEDEFEKIGGYHYEAEAFKVIKGLGFNEEDYGKMVDEFSGGYKMRIVLARLLLNRPNLLLLDEPTNHLDIESIQWLEDYLQKFNGAMIVVSHDRYFLDKILKNSLGNSGIIEIDLGRFLRYRTDYTGYLRESQLRKNRLMKMADLQRKRILEIKDFIRRNRANKSKAGIVRSRMKLLARMERIQIEREHKRIRAKFPLSPIHSRRLIELKKISKIYNGHLVFSNVSIAIYRGEKIALIGKNGAGKSTLCRIIAGCEEPTGGKRLASENLKAATFSHEIIERLNPDNSVIEELSRNAPDEISQNIRKFLGLFLFSGDTVYKKINVLSGGERTRLIILKAMIEPSNLLILDEPTYHLDKESVDAIKEAINSYEGTVILVTHNRDLIEAFAGRILELKDGKLYDYLGDFSYYLWKKGSSLKVHKKKGVDKWQQKILQKEERRNKLRKILSRPGVINNPRKTKKLFAEYQRLTEEIDELEKNL